nr:protein FAM117B-like [Loxodonta africana]
MPKRRRGGGRGARNREKVACPSPGGGGGGGRGKTMPRLRRGGRRERARRAGLPDAGRLRGGAHLSEARVSAPLSPDAAGDRAQVRLPPPPPPPPPPRGPSKSLDLGEGAALSGITTRAGRRPPEPSQFQKLSPGLSVVFPWLFDGNGSCVCAQREEDCLK